MAALHFQGRADAYLEWARASDFAWVGHAQPGSDLVSLLVHNGLAVPHAIRWQQVSEHALRTGSAACPAGVWSELAQAVDDDPVLNRSYTRSAQPAACSWVPDTADTGDAVWLACIDSGMGAAWFQAWQRAHPLRQVCHWDMDHAPASARPQPRTSHGAHVLSWLAGQPPYAGYEFDTDAASRCPLILVNLPRDAVEDPSGRWLGRYVLEALDFAIAQAQHRQAQHLVVNISWGPQTGPHDGSSLLEQALAQRIDAAQCAGLRVDVVLAAGNSRESRAHAQFDARQGCDELVWVVPPASAVPFFLELWWPAGVDMARVCVEATAPNGHTLHMRGEGVFTGRNAHGVQLRHPHPDATHRPMALLALNPTSAQHRASAHGRWRIRVTGIAASAGAVQVYVARQTANLGGRYRGVNSWLETPLGDAPMPACLSPEGTLSGLATAQHVNIHVAAGAIHSTAEPARYSSAGPAVAGALYRPDWALPTDETPGLRGILGAGSRPGSVVRLVGTSMAAPQLARLLLAGPAPERLGQPDPRTGFGVLTLGWKSRQRA